MSEELADVSTRREQSPFDSFAIGLIATGDNTDTLLQELFWSVTNGQEVFITYSTRPAPRVVEFARRVGAVVVDPLQSDTSVDDIERRLVDTVWTQTGQQTVVRRGRSVETSSELGREYSSPRTAVAIPAYNEGESIARVVEQARSVVDCVIVVDDGSDDDTARCAEEAGATVLNHGENRGYGAALRTGFREAAEIGVDSLVTLDADGQHDPNDVPRLVERQRQAKANIVIGSRYVDGSATDIPWYRRGGLWIINMLTNVCLGCFRTSSRIGDTQSGFRAYDARAIAELATSSNVGDGMGASTDILYHAHHHDYTIEEVGTTISYAVDGGSTIDPLSHGVSLVRNIFRTVERDRPLSVLGMPGFVTILVGLVVGYWGFTTTTTNGVFPIGTSLLATFAVLMGFLACFTAVILHALHTYFDPV